MNIRRILAPVDFSDCSNESILSGCEFAERFSAELHLLHVVAPWLPAQYASVAPYPIERYCKELDGVSLPGSGAKSVCRAVRIGVPADEILKYTNEFAIDLVVMGSHGRSGLTHLMLGSVAEEVARKARCTVVIVRQNQYPVSTAKARLESAAV